MLDHFINLEHLIASERLYFPGFVFFAAFSHKIMHRITPVHMFVFIFVYFDFLYTRIRNEYIISCNIFFSCCQIC